MENIVAVGIPDNTPVDKVPMRKSQKKKVIQLPKLDPKECFSTAAMWANFPDRGFTFGKGPRISYLWVKSKLGVIDAIYTYMTPQDKANLFLLLGFANLKKKKTKTK